MQKCCRIDEICQNIVHQANYVNHNKGQLNLTANKLCIVGSNCLFSNQIMMQQHKKDGLIVTAISFGENRNVVKK